jgi:two-component system response regulator YesN
MDILKELKKACYNVFIQMITRLALDVSNTTSILERNNSFSLRFNFNAYITELGSIETIDEINNIFLSAFDEIAENLNKKKDEKHDRLIDEVIKIVNEEYMDWNLSLENISSKVKISSSHLRHLFKRKTNQTLSDYINEVRLNRAKELLKNTSMSISEISNNIGFTSSSYFFTVFKIMNGITPNAFRQNKID